MTSEQSPMEIRYDVLYDVTKIIEGLYYQLDYDRAQVLVELSNRISDHFYGDVE